MDVIPTQPRDPSVGEYCRALEAHLCRRNEGHLVRIVGPGFELVSGWFDRGIPLTIASRGIDRYVERQQKKAPRRRPVRIEFCEADVLDVFDEWRRAVGVSALTEASPNESAIADEQQERRTSLGKHLERVLARLAALQGGDHVLDSVLHPIIPELQAARDVSRSIRGVARDALLARLRVIDGLVVDTVRDSLDAPTLKRLGEEADVELAPFRHRMPAVAYEQSRRACVDRLVRERVRLPTIAFE